MEIEGALKEAHPWDDSFCHADLLTFWFLLFGLVLVMNPKG